VRSNVQKEPYPGSLRGKTFETEDIEMCSVPSRGCVFLSIDITSRRSALCVYVYNMSLCTRGGQTRSQMCLRNVSPPRSHSVVARLQFSNRIRNSSQSMPRFQIQKPSTTRVPQGRRPECQCFRTRGTFELAPDDAQSPSEWYADPQFLDGIGWTLPPPEGLCGSCCVFSTGTHRVAA